MITRTQKQMVDYCDMCNGQTQVAVVIGELDLVFCGHHDRQYKDNLLKIATVTFGSFDWEM